MALSTIAEETKLKESLLEALERDDVSQWPSGIFRRSYLRAYARAIGLDPDPVVQEFLQRYPDSVDMPPSGTLAWPEPDGGSAGPVPTNRFRRLMTTAMAAVPAFRQRADAAAEEVVLAAPAIVAEAHDLLAPAPATCEPSLSAAADLCTRLGRVSDTSELMPLLQDAATLVDAVGVVLWAWDHRLSALRASLAHGYSREMLARLPVVTAQADNAIAAAFRSADVCIVDGTEDATGALVVPLPSPAGCAGVLALEVRNGGERRAGVRAFATILAAQLGVLLAGPPLAEAAGA